MSAKTSKIALASAECTSHQPTFRVLDQNSEQEENFAGR